MDNDIPPSRVERTFWTVWYYITGAVNRLLRPEPTDLVSNDPTSLQDSAVDSEPANCGHAEGEASAREVNEEQSLATVSVLSSSRPVVAWELCTTDIDLGSDDESMQYKTQLSRGSEGKASEEGEGTREEQFAQTGNDDAGLPVANAKEDEQKEGVRKLYAHERDETPENDESEDHVNTRSILTGDAMSEDVEEIGTNAGAEEETERALTPNDQKMDATLTKIQVTEEDNKMYHEDEQDLEAEDIEVQLCTITDLSLEEEDNMHIEEAMVQMDQTDRAATNEDVENNDGELLLASKNENKSDEGANYVENQLSICELLSDDNRDYKGDPSFTTQHVELQMAHDKSGIVSEDDLIVVGQEHVMVHRSESDEVEDMKEKEDASTLDEREEGPVIEEENVNDAANSQTKDEMQEQEDDIKSVTEDSQEEDISTGNVTCSEEVVQNVQTELHAAIFTKREDVAKDTEVQTKIRETDDVETESHGKVFDVKFDVTTTDISVAEICFDKDQVEEESLSSEVGNKESYLEVVCTATSVTVKPEGETGQEISGDFKNIPVGICEGRLVVSQELNSPTCEETQEGVPEYNNEPGPNENTTQRFLEVRASGEIQSMQFPEEMESKEPENLQNSGCSAGAEYLPLREHMEEEQESTGDIKNSFDPVVEEHAERLRLTDAGLPQETETPLVEPVIQESGLLFEEEEGKVLLYSMKTGIEHSEKQLETHSGLTDESDKTTEELQDGTEELLVEFEKKEKLCESKEAEAAGDGHEVTGIITAVEVVGFTDETLKFLEAEEEKMTAISFFQESVDAINSEQNSYQTHSLLEDFNETGLLKQSAETEPKLCEDNTVEVQDAGIHMEETVYGVEEEAAIDEMLSKNEMEFLNQQAVGMAAELVIERNEEENAESESSRIVETLETENQLSDEALEMSSEESEAADESMTTESKPKDLTEISAEETEKCVTESDRSYTKETVSPVSGCPDVIDEEILDLWIETALSEDTDDVKQEEDPGQQIDMEMEPSNEKPDEMSSVQREKVREQLVGSNSGESELVSDTEMSSSTAESGFLDQSLSEWGTQNSETQLLKSTSTGSFHGIYDMSVNMSESGDISELSTQQPNSESQDILMEETAETVQTYLKEEESITETGFHPDSGVSSSEATHLDQKSDESQEKTDEETGSQKEIDAEVPDPARKTEWKDTEESDVKSLKEITAIIEVEETKLEDEPLVLTVSEPPEGIEHTEPGRSRSGSETLDISTETGSQGDTFTELEKTLFKLPSLDKPQPTWSEDNTDPLPGLNEAVEQPTTESEDQMEVDASGLDFSAQRSRIAVKNPLVRPPKDPRSLLLMPSVEPTPSSRLPVKVPAGLPLGGLGIGIKLPGLGAGFPVLKKTQRIVRDENSPDTVSQEPDAKPAEKSDTPKQDEIQHKPKWMPPKHPGFGNPLMSELKTKLKKTTKE
ncbi:uveal autoantigen with coiled-coil domains and ankyrin repeats protein [Dicentrarchus labrax]|nr:uveal autoantigen with coiled-coil domains and ankyrin repeats protein [Dicentrarchus labrax]